MKNTLGKSFYSLLGIVLITQNILSVSAFNVKTSTTSGNTQLEGNTQTDMVTIVQNIVGYIVGLLYLIAVIVVLYGGFLILTAGGDEEGVKKGKKAIVNGAIGLVVIFLASSLVNWLIGLFGTSGAATV